MFIDRHRFLLLATALSAAPARAADGAAPPIDARPDGGAATPAVKLPAGVAQFCETIATHNRLLLASPGGWCVDMPEQSVAMRSEIIARAEQTPFINSCRYGKGTWARMLVSVSLDGPSGESSSCGWVATFRWVFQPAPETPLSGCSTSGLYDYDRGGDSSSDYTPVAFFDYTGEGRDELLLSEKRWDNSGSSGAVPVAILKPEGLSIVPYGPGGTFDGVVDADLDGRPDLLRGAFVSFEHLGLSGYGVNGMPLLEHSLPDGGFSATDDMARRWAATVCPSAASPNLKLLDRDPEGTSEGGCEAKVSCMRMWGRSEQGIEKWVRGAPECETARFRIPDAGLPPRQSLPFAPLNCEKAAPLPHPTVIFAPSMRGE